MLARRIPIFNIRTHLSPSITSIHSFKHQRQSPISASVRRISTSPCSLAQRQTNDSTPTEHQRKASIASQLRTPPHPQLEWPILQPNESQTHTLTDSRILGYSSYGPDNGYPLVFFHGLPGSRLDALSLSKLDPDNSLGLRIIGIDRPGMGLSSPHPNRTLLDYPSDVKSLVRYLGLKEYKILGVSGGGPYALVCAHEASRGRLDGLKATGVMYGLAPIQEPTLMADMNWNQYIGFKLIPYIPLPCLRVLYYFLLGRHALNSDPRKFEEMVDKIFVQGLNDDEKEIMYRPEAWREFTNSLRQAVLQGGDGYARDAKLLMEAWGFRVEDVDAKVLMWWGTEDDNAPVSMGRWLEKRMQNARLREFEGETHWTLDDRYGKEILRELVNA